MRFFCGWLMGFLPYVATKCTVNKKKNHPEKSSYTRYRQTLFFTMEQRQDRLERFQRRAFKVILRKPLFEHCDHDAILLAIQQPSLESRRQYQAALLGFQLAHETAPKHLLNTSFPKTSTPRTLRQRTPFQLPVPNTFLFQSSPLYFASHTFNNLPPHIRSINTLPEFKRKAQQHILSYSCPCSRHLN